jgi:hypothetical protein
MKLINPQKCDWVKYLGMMIKNKNKIQEELRAD